MRLPFPLAVLLLVPSAATAQNKEIQDAADQKLATIRYVRSLHASTGGFLASTPAPNVRMRPTLRATSAAVRSLKYLTGKPAKEAVPDTDKVAAFVLSCFDSSTGGFADVPGGMPDVFATSVGVMAAVELDIPKEKYRKAMDYLKANAKTFEDVRIGAAAVEAWGVKDCPFDLTPWHAIADKQLGPDGTAGADEGIPRETASVIAMKLRLGVPERDLVNSNKLDDVLQVGQWADGGYGRAGAKGSDLESTYRVMRAYVLMRERPKERGRMREFVAKCRNADGGYGVKPGEPSNVGGVYYATIVTKWLDEMEKK